MVFIKHGSSALINQPSHLIMLGQIYFVLILVKYGTFTMDGNILQGGYTDISHYPHQVFLEINGRDPCVCGASILNQVIVLTAAHCLEDLDPSHSKVTVMYGSEKISEMKMKPVKSYMLHEKYDYESMYADLALIRCKTPLMLGKFVKKAAIMEHPPLWSTAYVAGWGMNVSIVV